MAYLKVWMGVTSGTFNGRDDGYPEKKLQLVDTLEQLASGFDPKAEYFKLEKVDVKAAVAAINDLAK